MRIWLIFLTFLVLIKANIDTNETNKTLLNQKIFQIKNRLNHNEFYISYQSYLNYKELENKLKKYKYLARKNPKKYKEKLLSIQTELNLLKNNKNIFDSIIKIKELPPPPQINNPFAIINGFNYEKEIKNILEDNEISYKKFKETLLDLKKLNEIYKKEKLNNKKIQQILDDFNTIDTIYKTKLKTIKNKAEIYIQTVKNDIKKEINRLIYLAISIIISILIFIFIKLTIRKYIKDENIYTFNKIINFINFSVIILIISFFYINNATYLITILGFASAGIAIAMKDWFMNIFGWFVILGSGTFKVGDRIKVYMQNGNVKIVGDVIDITPTKFAIYEDVTLTTYLYNRRAGRIVFIPNNVIFTHPIFNYTHHGLSTVWDGIDITITFDSNYKKAVYLAKEIVNKYSKGYTDITKRRIKKLKAIYHIKNTNLEPRIYTFIEENGIRISCWFLNNYATLNLRSTISAEILESFLKEDDIKIAYPTYQINGKIKMEEDEKFTQA